MWRRRFTFRSKSDFGSSKKIIDYWTQWEDKLLPAECMFFVNHLIVSNVLTFFFFLISFFSGLQKRHFEQNYVTN